MRQIIFIVAMLTSTGVFACSFDTDCQPGSRCLKAPAALYGVCAGGLMPGNSNDRQPVTAPLDINRTYGNTCTRWRAKREFDLPTVSSGRE